MNSNFFDEKYNRYLCLIEDYIKGLSFNGLLEEAEEYSISSGGKRIRPVIALAVCEAFGGSVEDILPYAVAIEMIHTYSLIHDDLPCMDNDDIRRGKPSCHKKYGETLALLAGDGLLTKAFAVAATGRYTHAIGVISDNAYKMVLGQADEFINAGNELSVEKLLDIYGCKTGALFVAAALCGAISAGADEAQQKMINDYAYNLGLAFQIEDDLLDADKEDIKIISLIGKNKAYQLGEQLSQLALDSLDKALGKDEFLSVLTNKLLKRTK